MNLRSPHLLLAVLCTALWCTALAVGPKEEPNKPAVVKNADEEDLTKRPNPFKELLKSNGIAVTAEGVLAYLKKVQPTPERYELIGKLIKQLGSDGFRERRAAEKQLAGLSLLAYDAIERATAAKDPEISDRSKRLLKKYQESNDRQVLDGVIETARRVRPKGGVVVMLSYAPLLRQDYSRRILLDAVVRSAGPSDTAVLVKALAGESGPSRSLALAALARLEKNKAVERSTQFLKDKDHDVRLAAAEILGDAGDRRAVAPFITLLESDDEWIRARSIVALREMTSESVGYSPYMPEKERAAAAATWKKWWTEKGKGVKVKATSRIFVRSHLNGNTLLSYGYRNRVVELDAAGREVWTHDLQGAWSAEKLANGNVLCSSVGQGVIREVNRKGAVVWEYRCSALNARPLRNGNILIADFSGKKAIELEKKTKKVVWEHATLQSCADAIRLKNGNTLVAAGSLLKEVSRTGKVVWSWNKGQSVYGIHRLRNGNTLIADLSMNKVLEITPKGNTIWEFEEKNPCDVFRQANGNTLITSRKRFIEVTPKKEIVWSKEGCSYGSARR